MDDDESNEELTEEVRDRISHAVTDFLRGTLDRMGLDVSVHEHHAEQEFLFELEGPDSGLAIGKKGATLDALQLLAARVASKIRGAQRVPITLDAEGYRERRERTLTQLAERLGERAVRQGQVITLDPMTARERRVVHMALAKFPGVTTRSEGEGYDRRLKIIPLPGRGSA